MWGLHKHHRRHAAHPDDTKTQTASGNEALAPDGTPGPSDLGAWSEEIAHFMNKRAGSYGLLLEEMRTSRDLFELAAVQRRWWLNTIRDYAGFTARPHEQTPPSDQAGD